MTEQTETQTEDTAGLNIADLTALRQIIDVATARGAFRANEMVQVGTIYNKLDSFLTAVSQQVNQQPTQGATPNE